MKTLTIISEGNEDQGDLPAQSRTHSSASLRQELSFRARMLAKSDGLLHDSTMGTVPSIIFGKDDRGRHGNFHGDSYAKVCERPEWSRRLSKTHTAYKRARARADWEWKELDCANSSDALLMNVFCHPDTFSDGRVATMLGVEADAVPVFGYKPRTPLQRGRDCTEIDLKLGSLLIEAKLTETGFQQARPSLIDRYRDIDEVFDRRDLPASGNAYAGYQLIRGTLAAYATGESFCVLCDGRRADLIEAWYKVLRAVISCDLRSRLKLLTWQELASVLPLTLTAFLEDKYGIRGCPNNRHV